MLCPLARDPRCSPHPNRALNPPPQVDSFDVVRDVPTVNSLLGELDAAGASSVAGKQDYMQTSLAPSVRIFEKFLGGLKKEQQEMRRAAGSEASVAEAEDFLDVTA